MRDVLLPLHQRLLLASRHPSKPKCRSTPSVGSTAYRSSTWGRLRVRIVKVEEEKAVVSSTSKST